MFPSTPLRERGYGEVGNNVLLNFAQGTWNMKEGEQNVPFGSAQGTER